MHTLYCLPYAGGSSCIFQNWNASLRNEGISVVSLDYFGHGRYSGLPFSGSIQEIAEMIYSLLVDEDMSNASFYGHSMGALVLYELYCILERRSSSLPRHLFFSGSKIPMSDRKSIADVKNMSDGEFIDFVLGLKATPGMIFENKEMLEYFLPILRSDFSLVGGYMPTKLERLIHSDCTVLYGEEEDISEQDALEWCDLCVTKPKIMKLPGDHFFIHDKESQSDIFKHIGDEIVRASSYR